MFDDDEPKDWEIQDEEAPQPLKEKWAKDEILGPETVICPSCGQRVSADSLQCLYCGNRVLKKSGLLGSLASWFKSLWSGK